MTPSGPAVILDPKLGGRFIADHATVEPSGWLHARGRVRRGQAGELPDVAGPVVERSWSASASVRVEWLAEQGAA